MEGGGRIICLKLWKEEQSWKLQTTDTDSWRVYVPSFFYQAWEHENSLLTPQKLRKMSRTMWGMLSFAGFCPVHVHLKRKKRKQIFLEIILSSEVTRMRNALSVPAAGRELRLARPAARETLFVRRFVFFFYVLTTTILHLFSRALGEGAGNARGDRDVNRDIQRAFLQ